MEIINVEAFEIAQIIPVLLVMILVFVFSRTLVLPEGYYKDKMVREAMMKRRAEKADLERMAEQREIQQRQEESEE